MSLWPPSLAARLPRAGLLARSRWSAMALVVVGAPLLVAAVATLGFSLGESASPRTITLPYAAFLAQVRADNVQAITLDTQTDDLTGTLLSPASDGQQTARHFRTILYPNTPDPAFRHLLAQHHVRIASPAPESGRARLAEALLALLGIVGAMSLIVGLWRLRGSTPRSHGSPHLL